MVFVGNAKSNFGKNTPFVFKLWPRLIFALRLVIHIIQNINFNLQNYKSYFNFLLIN
jgi:hypothetical protein